MYSALVLLDNQKRMMYYLMVLVLLFLAELFYFRVADKIGRASCRERV